jgi:anti-anti-sigma factor
MATDLRVSVVKDADIWVVRPTGEVDSATVERLREALSEVHGPVLVDCSRIVFIDAAGLGALAAASGRNGSLTLRHTSPLLRRILRATGLESLVALEER